MRPTLRSGAAGRAWTAGLAAGAMAACAGTAATSGPPLDDPGDVAARARRASGPDRPHRVRVQWDYADERGPVDGDGVLRYNPPDSMRLDLFGPGGGNMSVALAGSGLRSVGQIENVRIPPPPFLYASAGIFRPGRADPDRGFRSDGSEVLVYGLGEGGALRFRLRRGRLQRVEEVRGGRVVREVELEWSGTDDTEAAAWPSSAEYRDRSRGSRARWRLERSRAVEESFPPGIFDLPPAESP